MNQENNILSDEEKANYFNDFIEIYKENTLEEKQKKITDELKEMIAVIQKISSDNQLNLSTIVNREIVDVNKENYTQDDFAEAVYVYLQMFKENLAVLLEYYTRDEYE